eukprot:scaffold556337_cov42-Prasinocladus_malaysianus.AAC.1
MASKVASHLPAGFAGLIKVVENWTFSFFFCAAELWGTVVISVLFWSLANDVCSVAEAKTVYPLIGFSANIALVAAGNYIKFINSGPAAAGISASLAWLISTVVVATGVMCCAKAFIDFKDYYASKQESDTKKTGGKKKKSKGSFGESLQASCQNWSMVCVPMCLMEQPSLLYCCLSTTKAIIWGTPYFLFNMLKTYQVACPQAKPLEVVDWLLCLKLRITVVLGDRHNFAMPQ